MNIKTSMDGNTLRPEKNIAIGKRDPEFIFFQPQNDRVVQNTAFGIGDKRIFTLTNRHFAQVARG